MFKTFRHRLLFWFLILVSSNAVIFWLTNHYLRTREEILHSTDLIEASYILLLKDAKTQQDFFSYETKNASYFQSGKSVLLQEHQAIYDRTQQTIRAAVESDPDNVLESHARLKELNHLYEATGSLFNELVILLKERGYKDYNLEGDMRFHAHWLEKYSTIKPEKLLSLRRHEKDFIIRNEPIYVTQLNDLVAALKKEMATQKTQVYSDSTWIHLNAYHDAFNRIVSLDNRIGIKDNTGLKLDLDIRVKQLEASFNQLVMQANMEQEKLFDRLNLYYVCTIISLLVTSVLISYFISRKITQPLSELSHYVSRFVESNFSEDTVNPGIRSKDELGKLTQNFVILKDEVVDQIKHFKRKVAERTQELADANQKLIKVNEANSRFVPKEFLQFLSKDSIEEVMLGDQVEHEMTVMFTDIRSFTKISESLTPQENFDFINGYLKEIVPVIRRHHGFIDKYIGDSVMALFPDTPDAALFAALEFEKAVHDFNQYLLIKGLQPVIIGSGIHTGRLILGTIGNDQRLETTVISDSVNIASRMEGLTKHFGCSIIVSEETVSKLQQPEKFFLRYLDTVRVKGKAKSLSIYEVLQEADGIVKALYEKEFSEAMDWIKEKRLTDARNRLAELALRYPEDGVIAIHLRRCDEFLKSGLPDEWDGVHVLTSK
jgi:adenylate cyclase